MNYLTQIIQFYDWLDTHPMRSSSIALYHALLHLNNKCRWCREFEVALSVLSYKTGLSERMVRYARSILADQKLIKWRSRGGNLSAVYSIAFIPTVYKELEGEQAGEAGGKENEISATIDSGTSSNFNDNKLTILYKQEEIKPSICIDGENKILSSSVSSYLYTLLGDKDYLEIIAKNKRLSSQEDVILYLKHFAVLLTDRGDEKENLSDFKAHFANWISCQQKKLNSQLFKNRNDENTNSVSEANQVEFIDSLSID